MQGLIWNCRGLRKSGVATFLKSLIFQYNLHFIGLQETMVEDCEDSLLRKMDNNQEYLWLWNASNGKSGAFSWAYEKNIMMWGPLNRGTICYKLICGINKIVLNGIFW